MVAVVNRQHRCAVISGTHPPLGVLLLEGHSVVPPWSQGPAHAGTSSASKTSGTGPVIEIWGLVNEKGWSSFLDLNVTPMI